jgi:hypothetical protein
LEKAIVGGMTRLATGEIGSNAVRRGSKRYV